MKLNPQHLTVDELLQGRLFRIPDYQRAYSWGTVQRNDLFKDIEESYKTGRDHFMATVVVLKYSSRMIKSKTFSDVLIVDGQQRITTIVILLKAIEKSLMNSDNKDEEECYEELHRILIKSDDHNIVLLQTNHDSSDVFSSYVRDGLIRQDDASIVTAADKNVADAALECEQFVEEWKAKNSELEKNPIIEILSIIRNNLSVIYHEISDDATVYRVFEVLNSRGLDVRWLDKCKSQLMGSILRMLRLTADQFA